MLSKQRSEEINDLYNITTVLDSVDVKQEIGCNLTQTFIIINLSAFLCHTFTGYRITFLWKLSQS